MLLMHVIAYIYDDCSSSVCLKALPARAVRVAHTNLGGHTQLQRCSYYNLLTCARLCALFITMRSMWADVEW
jgi:hypothetical protein